MGALVFVSSEWTLVRPLAVSGAEVPREMHSRFYLARIWKHGFKSKHAHFSA